MSYIKMLIIEKKIGQEIWFTSDTHYNHNNICSSTTTWKNVDQTRQFDSLELMNQTLIKNINSVVKEDDILFHLGDWSFGGFDKIFEFREQIKCKNIHLILGNHDHHIENDKLNISTIFRSVNHYLDLKIKLPPISKGQKFISHKFVLMHYPIASWKDMNQGVIHIHGHVHLPSNQKLHEGKAMDIGADGNNLFPYKFEEIISLMENKSIKNLQLPKDHHEERRDVE